MSWIDHLKMLGFSALLVIASVTMVITMIFANAALAQWRVDVNVARRDAVMQIIRLEDNK